MEHTGSKKIFLIGELHIKRHELFRSKHGGCTHVHQVTAVGTIQKLILANKNASLLYIWLNEQSSFLQWKGQFPSLGHTW